MFEMTISELHAASQMHRLLLCSPEMMHVMRVQLCAVRRTLFEVFICI